MPPSHDHKIYAYDIMPKKIIITKHMHMKPCLIKSWPQNICV